MNTRNQIQSNIVNSILENSFTGIIDVAPRVGKSKIVCDAIKASKCKKILITVPYNSIIESWNNELQKWKVPKKFKITIINQRSLHLEDPSKYELLICDEVHMLSENQIESVKNFSRVFGLSGSISDKTEKLLKKELNLKIFLTYSIEDAIRDSIIADYEIKLIPVMLDDNEKYLTAGTKDKPFLTTEYKQYQYLTSQFEKFKRLSWNNSKLNVVKMSAANKRANLIYNAKSKIAIAKELIDTQDRALIFTARTEVADSFSDSYHSKSPDDTLDKFFEGTINKLSVCEMTNMGITFPNLKTGIFHQMKSSEENAIQKVMRMCNMEDDEIATIYITYFANTVDEEWTRKALSGLNPDKITIISKF